MYRPRVFPIWAAAIGCLVTTSLALADAVDDEFTEAAEHYSAGRWSQAAERFQRLIERHPKHEKSGTIAFFLGESLVQDHHYAAARPHFADFLQREPQHRLAKPALFRSGEAAYFTHDHADAKRQLEQFLQRHAHDDLSAYALTYLGEIALEAQDSAGARTRFAAGLQRFPRHPAADDCQFGLGRAAELAGNTAAALSHFRLLAEKHDSSLADDAQLQIGLLEYRRQEYAAAAKSLDLVRTKFPSSEHRLAALYWRGVVETAQRNWAAASATLTAAAEESGDDHHALRPAIDFAAGEALRKQGDFVAADSYYQRVVALGSDHELADDSAQARVQLAFEARRFADAETLASDFDRTFPVSPLRVPVRQMHGRAQLRTEKYADAATTLKSALVDGPAAGSSKELDAANRYYLALAYLGLRRWPDALDSLNGTIGAAIELRGPIELARAAALVGMDRAADAVAPLRGVLKSQPAGPDAARAREQLTAALAESGELDAATYVLRELKVDESTRPQWATAALRLAEAAYKQEQYQLARELFSELAADSAAGDVLDRTLSGLGWTEFQLKDHAAAQAAWERLQTERPDSALAPDVALAQAKSLTQLGRDDEARVAYQRLLERYPQSPQIAEALFGAARAQARAKEYATAAELFRRLIDEHPQFEQRDAACYQFAWVLADGEQSEAAQAWFERLVREFPNSRFSPDATYRLAELAWRKNDGETAKRLLNQLLDLSRDERIVAHALYLKGQVLAAEGRWEDVDSAMQRVVDESAAPESLRLSARFWLAEALYRRGQIEAAGKRFAELRHEAANRQEDWAPLVPLRLAQTLAHAQRWDEAYDVATRIVDDYPDFRQGYEVDYLIGRCLASQGQFTEAREAYERVIRSPSGGRTETAARAQWMIGESFFHQQHIDEALKSYQRVVRLYEFSNWQAAALLQIGKCHEQKSAWHDAVRSYAQLLKDYPQTTFAADAARRLPAAQRHLTSEPQATRTK